MWSARPPTSRTRSRPPRGRCQSWRCRRGRSGIAGMADLLVDTDVLVDHLRKGKGFNPGGHSVSYSVITRAELFAGLGSDEEIVQRLLSAFRELPVNRDV